MTNRITPYSVLRPQVLSLCATVDLPHRRHIHQLATQCASTRLDACFVVVYSIPHTHTLGGYGAVAARHVRASLGPYCLGIVSWKRVQFQDLG